MTNPEYTAVALLVDRSGSMDSIRIPTQDAVNEFVRGQALQDGKRTVRISDFDSEYRHVNTSLPASEVPEYVLAPRGSTALYDAISRLINDFGVELRDMPEDERPANVVFAILTDGHENTSTFATAKDVARKKKHQEDHYNWRFLFLGANQDAILTGAQIGMGANSSMSYSASSVGVRNTREFLDGYVAVAAAGAAPVITDDDRKKAMQSE